MSYRRESYPETDVRPWLDLPDAEQEIDRRLAAGELSEEQAELCRKWSRDGYVVLEGVLDAALCERINSETKAVFDANQGLPHDQLLPKFLNMYTQSKATVEAMCLSTLYDSLDLLLGRRAMPYQTLNLPLSSQQEAHSDEILMTTHPPGFLIAAWCALEDVVEGCGPLAIVPGSHKLPYVSAGEIGIPAGASQGEAQATFDTAYYPRIRELIDESGLEGKPFLAKQGDVLLWHSNLLHGAYHVSREGATRKSLIVHYFAEGVEMYSDLWQRECLLLGLRT